MTFPYLIGSLGIDPEHDPDNGKAVGLANGFGFAAVGGVVVDQVHFQRKPPTVDGVLRSLAVDRSPMKVEGVQDVLGLSDNASGERQLAVEGFRESKLG